MTFFLLAPYRPTGHCPNASMASLTLHVTEYLHTSVAQNQLSTSIRARASKQESLKASLELEGERASSYR